MTSSLRRLWPFAQTLLLAAAAACCLAAVQAFAPGSPPRVAAGAGILLLPGFAITAALLPPSAALEVRLVYSIGAALATGALGTVLLAAVHVPLRGTSWEAMAVTVTVVASAVAAVQRRRPFIDALGELRGRLAPELGRTRYFDRHLRAILGNATSIVGTASLTAGLGVFYWLIAARAFVPATVGLASAAIAAMTLLATIAVIGLGTLLVGELSKHPGYEAPLIMSALLIASASGGTLGLAFAIVAPRLSVALRPLGSGWPSELLFAMGVALTSASLVFDSAVIGLLRGRLQFGRNALFAFIKLGFLAAAALLAGRGLLAGSAAWLAIYGSWTAGCAASFAVVLFWLRPRRGAEAPRRLRTAFDLLRRLGRASLAHHALNLVLQAPVLLLPIVVTVALSPAKNGPFYVALNIAWFVFVGPTALSTALFAVGSAAPGNLRNHLALSLGLGLGSGMAGSLFLILFAGRLLSFFGATYAHGAATALAILGLGVIPLTVRSHYVTLSRLRGETLRAAGILTGGAILELSLSAGGAKVDGLAGLSAGWVVALGVEGLLTAGPIYRALASPPMLARSRLAVG